MNARTGKPYLRAGYARATINHAVAVLAAFYGYHARERAGALLGRINEKTGANVTAHDLRHTLCLRLIADPAISLVDTQQVMRHANITTTGLYLRPRPMKVIAAVQEHYRRPKPEPRQSGGWDYDPADLADVFGQD